MPKGIKYGGRQLGSLNKKTVNTITRAERILRLIENKYFEKDIAKLTAGQRMDLYANMLEFVAPKLSRQEVNANVNNKVSLEIVRTYTTQIEHPSSAAAEGD